MFAASNNFVKCTGTGKGADAGERERRAEQRKGRRIKEGRGGGYLYTILIKERDLRLLGPRPSEA